MKLSNSAKAAEKQAEQDTGRFSNSLFDWGEAMIFSLLLVVVVFTFFFRLIAVDGTSMVPTLAGPGHDGRQQLGLYARTRRRHCGE